MTLGTLHLFRGILGSRQIAEGTEEKEWCVLYPLPVGGSKAFCSDG